MWQYFWINIYTLTLLLKASLSLCSYLQNVCVATLAKLQSMRVTSHHQTLMNRHFRHMSLLCLSGDGLIFHFCCVWGFGMLVVAVPVFQGMRGVSKLLIWRTSSRLFTHTSLPKFLGECLENWTKSRGGIDSNMPNLH